MGAWNLMLMRITPLQPETARIAARKSEKGN